MIDLLNPAIIGLLMLLVSILWMLRDESDKSRPILVIALILNLFYGWLLSVLMGRADALLPWKYDYFLFRIDGALGVSAASIASPFQGAWSVWLNIVYNLLLPMMILWVALYRHRDSRALIFAYVSQLIAGPLLYMILPAVGPTSTFGAAVLHPPAVQVETARLSGMPNAFPSLHIATALVLVFFARGRMWQAVSIAFLAGTALSTVAIGEHYVIDLVAGLSFGCFAAALGRRMAVAAAAYFAITVCWSLAIRFGGNMLVAHPGVLRISVILTIAISVRAVWIAWWGKAPFHASGHIPCPGVSLSREAVG